MSSLSIIIPAFNEQSKIGRDIEAAAQFLEIQRLDGEILVVDDGSDDNTARLAEQVDIPPSMGRNVLRFEQHRGKGAAVKSGVMASRGEFVLFADAGLTVPFDNAVRGLTLLRSGACDLAFGSRKLPESRIRKDKDWDRKASSIAFRAVTRMLLRIPSSLTDTQCGFKMFLGDVARQLFEQCLTPGFLFDVEIIQRALRQNYRILEFPVEWTCDRDSRIGITNSGAEVMKEILRIRRMHLTR